MNLVRRNTLDVSVCVAISLDREDQSLFSITKKHEPQEDDHNRRNDHKTNNGCNATRSRGLLFARRTDIVRPIPRDSSEILRPPILHRVHLANPLPTVLAQPGRRAGASRHTAGGSRLLETHEHGAGGRGTPHRRRDGVRRIVLWGLDGIHVAVL